MDNLNGHVMNLANSIIGVSILAMPYCFKQCGVLLSVVMLLISSIISRLTCHFLLKSAILARRKTFEFLAFHIFGPLGKFSIEVGMIGFLLGTCIAFFVVMGDLGPAIVSEMTGVQTRNALRNSILVALAIFCVLPLGLLRNVDSLNGVSKATIGFYCCLVLKIIIEALPHIFTGDWVSEVVLWRPAGILQCLPIFSMALFCQTQIFEIYQALPNASLDKMNNVIKVAVNICTWVYIFVGAFGYIAFFQKPFTGNILLSFRPSVISDVIKLGFVLSLAFSFPLVIFPCRASLYSLLYKGHSYTVLHEGNVSNYIPEGKFKMLTLIIVSVSLTIGLLIPNIELVLGLVGSTIGVMICVLFPVTCFICISPKNTNERILAQIMLFVGVIVMVLGTYANMYAFEEAKMNMLTERPKIQEEKLKEVFLPKIEVMDIPTTIKIDTSELKKLQEKIEEPKINNHQPESKEKEKEVRHEPPQPEEPAVENPVPSDASKVIKANEEQDKPKEDIPKPIENNNSNDKQGPVVEPDKSVKQPEKEILENKILKVNEIKISNDPDIGEIKSNLTNNKPKAELVISNKDKKKSDEIDIEAVKKEENELKEQEKEKPADDNNQILIDTIQKQNEVQKEIVEQQKKLIEVIQQQQENVNNQQIDKVNQQKLKAVKNIEDIARRAIESISGQKDILNEVNKDKPDDTNKLTQNAKNNDKHNQEMDQIKEKKNETNKVNLLPLPIVLAKLNNVTVDIKQEKPKKEVEVKKEEEKNGPEDTKVVGRDILAESSEAKIRAKRDVENSNETNSEKVKQLNKAVKEVCEEMTKLTSTERPIIKMLCKLSEPDLVEVDVEGVEKQNSVDVKPQKRDLKQFSGI